MKNILIADQGPETLVDFAQRLREHRRYFQVITAENGLKAIDIINRIPVDLVITGLRMPKMDGFELIAYLNKHHPGVRVIVMTDVVSPLVKSELRRLGVSTCLEEPVDLTALSERLFTEVATDYGGQLRGISLSSFLQMLELEGKTCALTVAAEGKSGRLFLRDGDVIDADAGALAGESAALAILQWEKILIDIDYSPMQRTRGIKTPLMRLLMESRKLLDEKQSSSRNQRRHDRVDCIVAVDYDLDNWSHRSVVKDISLGGAYVETDQPATIGEEVMLVLSTFRPHRQCSIAGKVVRRDKGGIGVRFDELSLHQLNMLKHLMGTSYPAGPHNY
jgi:CheY-like chemotaxis protein